MFSSSFINFNPLSTVSCSSQVSGSLTMKYVGNPKSVKNVGVSGITQCLKSVFITSWYTFFNAKVILFTPSNPACIERSRSWLLQPLLSSKSNSSSSTSPSFAVFFGRFVNLTVIYHILVFLFIFFK